MPFADEFNPDGVVVVSYQESWARQGADLISELRALVPDAIAFEHIGSTSIPGMAAKPCLDLMIIVDDLDASSAEQNLSRAGYRRRPEPWNNSESADGREWPKMVFAPPIDGRNCNIHVRPADAGTTRRALLFRDYLIANPDKVALWSDFKRAVAAAQPDLAGYGQIKSPAWTLLMECAERWAAESHS
ncbi:GrpB family protein [Microlunatus elymi]|uniref:GrpB family protein n=1 Tax=Microlunatus elymi TaxID=2596828 RepID=A0A516Q4V4_9ACTN|nr:GrpB family protein [Microlunatus elymi]QDP98251.1 GrpB family protein [Microlunatus elymi]